MTSLTAWALRAYPPSFRDRYGDELAAVVEGLPRSWRNTLDLYRGAGLAWLRPVFSGTDSTRLRLQASVSTVWVAWSAGFLLAPAISKALLDPPGPHVTSAVRGLLTASTVVFALGWLVAFGGAALIGWRALVPALRARQWSVLRPVLPAAVLVVIEAGGLVVLVGITRADTSHPSPAAVAVGSVWTVGLLALLIAMGLGPARVIQRLQPHKTVLRVPMLLAMVLAVCLATMTAVCALAVALAGDASLIGGVITVAVVVAVGVIASLAALVSSARGLMAFRSSSAVAR